MLRNLSTYEGFKKQKLRKQRQQYKGLTIVTYT